MAPDDNSPYKTCPRCGVQFEQRRADQVYCTGSCRLKYHQEERKRLHELGLQADKAK